MKTILTKSGLAAAEAFDKGVTHPNIADGNLAYIDGGAYESGAATVKLTIDGQTSDITFTPDIPLPGINGGVIPSCFSNKALSAGTIPAITNTYNPIIMGIVRSTNFALWGVGLCDTVTADFVGIGGASFGQRGISDGTNTANISYNFIDSSDHHHICAVYDRDNGIGKVYADGKLVAQNSLSAVTGTIGAMNAIIANSIDINQIAFLSIDLVPTDVDDIIAQSYAIYDEKGYLAVPAAWQVNG